MRLNKRSNKDLRKITLKRNYIKFAEGSCLIEIGNTKVICTASLEEGVPPFLRGKGKGWVSAEYSMIPRSCEVRVMRESVKGKISGRTHEIQRLVGRALRAVTDLEKLGERTIWIDCDVIQADGGTRCASITWSFIALCDALRKLQKDGIITDFPVNDYIAAISVGIIDGELCLDLDYKEDSKAEVDMNIVMAGSGEFVEIQGTAEGKPFGEDSMFKLIGLAKKGINQIIEIQKKLVGKIQ